MVKKFREIYMHTHTKFLCMHINFLKQKFHIYILGQMKVETTKHTKT